MECLDALVLLDFGYEGDPTCEVLQYWASMEGLYGKNMEKARLLWNDILQQGHDTSANMWMELAHLER